MDYYKQKYIKYKNKYISAKNNIKHIDGGNCGDVFFDSAITNVSLQADNLIIKTATATSSCTYVPVIGFKKTGTTAVVRKYRRTTASTYPEFICVKHFFSKSFYDLETSIYVDLNDDIKALFPSMHFYQTSDSKYLCIMECLEAIEFNPVPAPYDINTYQVDLFRDIVHSLEQSITVLLKYLCIFSDLSVANILKCKNKYLLIDIGSLCSSTKTKCNTSLIKPKQFWTYDYKTFKPPTGYILLLFLMQLVSILTDNEEITLEELQADISKFALQDNIDTTTVYACLSLLLPEINDDYMLLLNKLFAVITPLLLPIQMFASKVPRATGDDVQYTQYTSNDTILLNALLKYIETTHQVPVAPPTPQHIAFPSTPQRQVSTPQHLLQSFKRLSSVKKQLSSVKKQLLDNKPVGLQAFDPPQKKPRRGSLVIDQPIFSPQKL